MRLNRRYDVFKTASLFASCEISSAATCRLHWAFCRDVPVTARCRGQPKLSTCCQPSGRDGDAPHFSRMGMSTELFRHNGVTAVRGYTKDRLVYTELSRKAAIKNVNDATRKRGNDCCFFLAPGLQKSECTSETNCWGTKTHSVKKENSLQKKGKEKGGEPRSS